VVGHRVYWGLRGLHQLQSDGQDPVHSVQVCEQVVLIANRSIQNLVQPHQEELLNTSVPVVYYDSASVAALDNATPIPSSRTTGIKLTDLSNLIYTSGTTGMTKGVMKFRAREITTRPSNRPSPGPETGYVNVYLSAPLSRCGTQYLCDAMDRCWQYCGSWAKI
jgi:acyl-CoA synthetase (AMP-forming)/AMP-acid ligase II